MDEREQYEKGYRITSGGEFYGDEDHGPNGHFVKTSATKTITPEGIEEIVFKEELVSEKGDRPIVQAKITTIKRHN